MAENQNLTNNRIAIVDFLRGFAMLGVVISNFMAFQNPSVKNDGINRLLNISEEIFFGPVWILLSFLFGFGFWALIQKLKSQHQNDFWLFGQRMFWLFLIGIINACLFHIDILRDFAVLGMFLFVTPYFNRKQLLFLTVFLTICIPFLRAYTVKLDYEGADFLRKILPLFASNDLIDVITYNLNFIRIVQIQNPIYLISIHYEMFCFFLWGVLAARWKVFETKELILRISKFIFLFSFVGICLTWGMNYLNRSLTMEFSEVYNMKILTEILFAMLTSSVAALIYLSGIFKKLFHWIEIYGRMTLTNYLLQSIISLLIFSGFGFGIGKNQPLWIYFVIALATYLLQLAFSFYWLKKYKLGPAEWLWRSLSTRKILSI